MKHKNEKQRVRELINRDFQGNASSFARACSLTPNQLQGIMSNPEKGLTFSLLKGAAESGIDIVYILTGDSLVIKNKSDEQKIRELNSQIELLKEILKPK